LLVEQTGSGAMQKPEALSKFLFTIAAEYAEESDQKTARRNEDYSMDIDFLRTIEQSNAE
jgi:hypothetical protein